jgi:hypothetical protein
MESSIFQKNDNTARDESTRCVERAAVSYKMSDSAKCHTMKQTQNPIRPTISKREFVPEGQLYRCMVNERNGNELDFQVLMMRINGIVNRLSRMMHFVAGCGYK